MTWNIFVRNSDGITWDADGTVNRFNTDLEITSLSTQQKIRLADGSNAFITPETKKIKESLSWAWLNVTTALITQIETYIDNGDEIKIVTHASDTFIGRFIDMKRVWYAGREDEYDLSVVFERTE